MNAPTSSRYPVLIPLVCFAGVLLASPVAAFEAFAGRLQAHGYYELQLRGISKNYSEAFDVTQWYNVFDLELEIDIAPNGVGPFDSISAFVRAEVRYDCIYSRGCGFVSAVDVYGNEARDLPPRLNNARRNVATAALARPERTRRHALSTPTTGGRRGTDYIGDSSDGLEHIRSGSRLLPTQNLEPLLSIPPFKELGGLAGVDGYFGAPPTMQRDEFFVQRDAQGEFPGENVLLNDDAAPYVFGNFLDFLGSATNTVGGSGNGLPVSSLLPWRPKDFAGPNALLADRVNPFDKTVASPGVQNAAYNAAIFDHIRIDNPTNPYEPGNLDVLDPDTWFENIAYEASQKPFFKGPTRIQMWKDGYDFFGLHRRGGREAKEIARNGCTVDVLADGLRCFPATALRPIPLVSASSDPRETGFAPQGLFLPSRPLREALQSGRISDVEYARNFNLSEVDRAWNRGASQRQTKELKEAYLDIELFDSDLWLRIGKQNIVWGKTELFRTTDQFNPQDFSLASLPSLEESRIPLWAFRAVYSLYDVGPLDDVRLEAAFNYDEYKGIDIGACGEPYAPPQTCSLSTGVMAHGATGIGIAGIDIPPSPWEDIKGWEGGVRVEFRSGRFSFALTDFYGFEDVPYVDILSLYERNVDPDSGRPRIIGATEPCVLGDEPSCLTGGPVAFDPNSDGIIDDLDLAINDALLADPRNALDSHHANQQLYATICASTIGITTLDATACSLGIFNSGATLPPIPPRLGEFTSALLAGSPLAVTLFDFQTGIVLPLVQLSQDPNDEFNPNFQGQTDPCTVENFTGVFKPCSASGEGFFAPLGQTLAQTLTVEQEALFGCGAYFGTNCDINGIDLMNAEASVILQSFIGFDGVFEKKPCQDHLPSCWTTNSTLPQPGTLGFHSARGSLTDSLNIQGGPVGTRYAFEAGAPKRTLRVLPGARRVTHGQWSMMQDGCNAQFVVGNPSVPSPSCGDFNGGSEGPVPNQRALYHPLALDTNGNRQIFSSEMAAASWNLMTFVVANDSAFEETNGPGECSFATPHLCGTIHALMSVAGLTRNIKRAAGNESFGRRTFFWHSGGEATLSYKKRNVLGFSMDFAEDWSKTSWGMEFSWVGKRPVQDNLELSGHVDVQDFNLSIAIDRPTIINFLNPGRSFFLSTQFFFQYRKGFNKESTAGTGPFNFLFTASAGTGYFTDRLLANALVVYGVQSRSGAVIPQITYRYSAQLRLTIGFALFFGEDHFSDIPVTGILPTSNQLGEHAYQSAAPNGIGVLRDRDEVFMRVRYTF